MGYSLPSESTSESHSFVHVHDGTGQEVLTDNSVGKVFADTSIMIQSTLDVKHGYESLFSLQRGHWKGKMEKALLVMNHAR